MKRLLITTMQYKNHPCRVTALWEDGKIQTLHMDQEGDVLLGSIHVGKVQKVLPNIGGAFIEIQDRLPCYLPLKKNPDPIYTNGKKTGALKAEDEILVQVTQEALKTKAPCVSCNLSFQGNYLVLTTENKTIGASGKLSKRQGEALKKWMEEILPEDRTYGIVFRTNSKEASKEQMEEELYQLQKEYEKVMKKATYSSAHSMLRAGESSVITGLKRVYWDSMEKVITDDPDIYHQVCSYVENLHLEHPCPIQLYADKLLPLYKLYSLEQVLEDALGEKVWLKSGGFLIIQQTEAFVSIDVNSGKQVSKKTGEEQYLKINLEAGKEIARQLRLRNLYGMILVDFINMRDKENQELLLNQMRSYVHTDRIKTTVVDITPLGIMEITRKKEEKSLQEQMAFLSGLRKGC